MKKYILPIISLLITLITIISILKLDDFYSKNALTNGG